MRVNVNAIDLQKQRLRTDMMSKRDALSAIKHAEWSRCICETVIARVLQPLANARDMLTLFSYVPYRSELNVGPIIEWAWAAGHRVVFPRVIPQTSQMELRVVHSFDHMEANRWGILEPSRAAVLWTKPVHVVIVPGLAFDRAGGRLGYGGGYYDRWLKQQESHFHGEVPFILAPSFELQVVDKVPAEAHDRKVDLLITEKT